MLAVVISLFLTGCERPSEKDIEQAVHVSLKRAVPTKLTKKLMQGENASVEEVRVIKIGSAQRDGSLKYWPVKVYAKGTCDIIFFDTRQRFEGEAEFFIYKDPYGNWVATPGGLGF